MTIQAFIDGLSREEKLEAMELLWQDLSQVPANVPSPDWHRRVLEHRVANPSPGDPIPLDDAIANARERLNARRTQG